MSTRQFETQHQPTKTERVRLKPPGGGLELWHISKLRPPLRQTRVHSKKQIRELGGSLTRFGQIKPIIVDSNDFVVAGWGCVLAAREVGIREIKVIRLAHLTPAEIRAYALADNRLAEKSGWDRELLAIELGELKDLLSEVDLDLSITGFEAAEIDGLLGDLVDREDDPADEAPAIADEAVSRIGDNWDLGQHRLRCGDATKFSDVRDLMDGLRATTMFTDPPYNQEIRSVQGRGKIKHREFVAASGELNRLKYINFLLGFLELAAKYSIDGAIHYVCMDWRHILELLTAGEDVFGLPKNLIVWNKTNAGQGTFYRSQHELIVVFKKGEAPHINNFELGQHGRRRSNVWTYPGVNTFRKGRLEDLASHPTVKPVAMVADALRDCSRRGDIVLDPFMGSGTTIMAAEKVGRRAFGLELDPLYVDVAIRRWQNYIKKDAILRETGETFDEVAIARSAPQPRRVR